MPLRRADHPNGGLLGRGPRREAWFWPHQDICGQAQQVSPALYFFTPPRWARFFSVKSQFILQARPQESETQIPKPKPHHVPREFCYSKSKGAPLIELAFSACHFSLLKQISSISMEATSFLNDYNLSCQAPCVNTVLRTRRPFEDRANQYI